MFGSIDDLYDKIIKIGFLPLFKNRIPGFSAEDQVPADSWYTGDITTDPWEWRRILSGYPDIAYGKFFEKKAGFISKEWLPAFINYRRNGYDFEALFEDELASFNAKKIMDAFEADDNAVGTELMSFDLKEKSGFGKNSDSKKNSSNFDTTLTELQMQTYVIISDFHRKKNRKGEAYGWNVAAYEMPETKFGYDFVTSCYSEKPEESWKRIEDRVKESFPDTPIIDIQKVLGIKYPGTEPDNNPGLPVQRKTAKLPKNKTVRPEKLPYPENLITAIGLEKVFGEKKYVPLTDDQIKGLEHAISTLKDREQQLLRYRFKEYMTFSGIGKEINRSPARVGQILTKALRKLSHPTRAVYYKEGFDVVEDRLRQEEERIRNQKATVNPDMGPFEIREALGQLAELSIYEMKLSVRSCNCLARAGIKDLYSLVITVYEDEERFRDIRNLGRLSIKEILKRLMKIGIAIPESYKDYIEL